MTTQAQVAAEASMVRARAVIDLATRWTPRSSSAMAPACSMAWSFAAAHVGADGADRGGRGRRPSGGPGGGFAATVNRAASEAYQVLGKQINLGSPKQLQVVLFDELGMPKTRRTRTGYTTDAEALQQLYVKTEHPFLAHLLVHRDAIRLKQTVEGLLKAVADDGRIHHVRADHRVHRPPLQHRPQPAEHPDRTEEGRRIRQAFVVGEGYDALMSADYSQIEMRIMAHASEDESLIEAFKSGMDFHTVTASRVFGVEPGRSRQLSGPRSRR